MRKQQYRKQQHKVQQRQKDDDGGEEEEETAAAKAATASIQVDMTDEHLCHNETTVSFAIYRLTFKLIATFHNRLVPYSKPTSTGILARWAEKECLRLSVDSVQECMLPLAFPRNS